MIKRTVKLLKKEIHNLDIYKEYIFLKAQIDSSQEIKSLKSEINELKQKMTKNINNENHSLFKKEYIEKTNELNTHPLIQNFNYIKQELLQELILIKEQIVV